MANAVPNLPPSTPPPPPGLGTGTKIALGCGGAVVVLIVVTLLGLVMAYRWAMGRVEEAAKPFEERGFTRVSGQQVVVTTPITVDTVYVGQVVRIETDAKAEVAIVAQVGEVGGQMQKKVWFRGQLLRVQPGAILEEGLDYRAQVVENNGSIQAELNGKGAVTGEGAFPNRPVPDVGPRL